MDTPQISQKARQQARPWIENGARCGYAAKGFVYVIIGVLALQAALGLGGQATDTQGALFKISQQSFGRVALFLLGLGLSGYALWRLVMAIWDSENKGHSAKAIVQRVGYALSGLAYGGLAFTSFQLVRGAPARGGHSAHYDWTVRLLQQPLGRWLIALVGLIVLAAAFLAFYKAFFAKFREHLKTHLMNRVESTWVSAAGRVGYTARGVVFLMIGWFFIRAALQADARESGGLDQALSTLARQPYGSWLLGIVAAGLIAYGLYSFCEAYYRRVDA